MSKPADAEHSESSQSEPNLPLTEQEQGKTDSDTSSKPFEGYLNSRKHPAGMRRHQGVIAGCGALTLAILGLGSMDLKSLIESKATIDTNFKMAMTPARAQLPSNLRYDEDANGEGLYTVVESTWLSSKKGFVDATGKIVIAPMFEDVTNFSGGLASAKDQKTQAWGFIDKTGKFVIPPKFQARAHFSDGVAAVNLVKGGKGALINTSGQVLFLSPKKETPIELAPGIYAASGPHNRIGMIGKDGKWIVGPQFDQIERVRDANRWEGRDWYIPSFSERIPDPNNDQFFKIVKFGRVGIISAAGKVVIPPRFDAIVSFNKGHAAFKQNDKYGFADSNADIVIEPQFDFVTAFDDLIVVKANNQWGLIDSAGKPVAGPAIDGVAVRLGAPWLSDGLGPVLFGERFGFLNSKGQTAIKPIYNWTMGFNEGYAPVWMNSRWHFIDMHGNLVGPSVGNIAQFSHGHAAITVPGPLYSFIYAKQVENEDSSIESKRLWIKKQGNQCESTGYQSTDNSNNSVE